MSHPYNFYQGLSGVAPYPSGLTGVYTPTGFLETPFFYQFRADQDLYEQKPQFEIGISGNVPGGGGFVKFYHEFVFSGSLMGLKSGTADFRSSFSGQQSKANLDTSTLQSNFSGRFTGQPIEQGDITLKITGSQKGFSTDQGEMEVIMSGQKPTAPQDSASLLSNWSGNIIKSDRDLVSFNVSFSGVEWNSYRPRIKSSISPDACSMSISLTRIVWSRAGG
jgi:hypothetical protein